MSQQITMITTLFCLLMAIMPPHAVILLELISKAEWDW